MENTLRHHLKACASAFASATDRAPSTVARLAAGDWQFFDRLDKGASFTARKYDEVMAWFGANWPDGKPWPKDVPRPALPANDTTPAERAA